jgi:inosose dehydratase
MNRHLSRRRFTRNAALSATLLALDPARVLGVRSDKLHIATNVYPWQTFYRRVNKDHNALLDSMLAQVAAAGLDGFEGIGGSPADLDRLIRLLKKHGLEMRSLYVNSTLHDPDQVESSITGILKTADKARAAGTRIIVTNPNPIRWGGPENKNDQQIRFQARALNRLGKALKAKGITLAYHFHDIELRAAARELHHMMVGTDPDLVSLCFDAHWVYRGAGNSEVAVFDIAALYAERISEVHIRQSKDDTWTEALGPGDIDYPKLVSLLQQRGVRPLLVLEQAVENASPNTMTAEAAHRQGVQYARRVFAPLG